MADQETLTNDDFRTPEEKQAQDTLKSLEDVAHEGALFSDWTNYYCTKKLFTWLDEQIRDSKNVWVSATSREEAEAIRLQTQSYTKIKNWILAKVNAGTLAAKGIKELHEEGVTLEGWIKPPTPK